MVRGDFCKVSHATVPSLTLSVKLLFAKRMLQISSK